MLYGSETLIVEASDAWRKTVAEVKYMRRTAGYTWTNYKTNKQLQLQTVPILFADGTCIIVKSPNSKDFQTNVVTAFNCVNKWFKINQLPINGDKTKHLIYTLFVMII